MQTRRDVLRQALALPFLARRQSQSAPPSEQRVEIVADSDLLSEESAHGFRSLLKDGCARNILIFPAARPVSRSRASELRDCAVRGAWIIWESAPYYPRYGEPMLERLFGRKVLPPIPTSPDRLVSYVRYCWPRDILIRSFLTVTPIECPPAEVIATCCGKTVGARWQLGRGGIVFLGAMLGPQIQAEDPHAREVGLGLLRL
ncbi:MAG: hypothetical protein JOY54_06370 [Acidobacteriaceae bacterium]|nr:hypothetical protein [Acidobacteriaceae bacterium]